MNCIAKPSRKVLWGFAVAAVTVLTYLNLLRNDFLLWDDDKYITENPFIRTIGWTLIKRAFTEFMQGNWHPLTILSHAFDYAIWGLNPVGHHWTSLLIHSLNAFLVVLLVKRIISLWNSTGADEGRLPLTPDASLAVAVIAGIMFGIHPLHVESVAWASERKDLLCGLFYLAAFYCYLNPAGPVSREPRASTILSCRPMQATLGFFLLALMSKPMAVSLPVVLMVVDRYLLRRVTSGKSLAQAVYEKLLFFVPALGLSLVTLSAQKSGVTTNLAEMMPLHTRLLVAAQSLCLYLVKMVVPVGLLPVYPYPSQHEVSITALSYMVPVAIVLGITVLLIRTYRHPGVWQPLFLYYAVTLFPVIGIIQVGAQSMADRYTYLPSLAPFILIGSSAVWFWQKISVKVSASRIMVCAGLCYMTALVWLTQNQIAVWRNSLVFWDNIIAKEPSRIPFAYVNRGVAYYKKGDLDKALSDLNRAVELMPGEFAPLTSRGMVLMEKGELEKALADFNGAISLRLAESGAYYNRGLLFWKRGERAKAYEDFTSELAVDPASLKALNSRGRLLQEMGEFGRALNDFNAALAVDPSDVMSLNNRGLLMAAKGEIDHALADYDTAARLKPDESSTYINRGLALSKIGEFDKAIADFDRAISLNPNESRAFNNRGVVNAQKGLMHLSLEDFTKAMELDPASAEVYVNRGLLFLKAGDDAHARDDFAKACELGEMRGCGFLK